MTRFWRRLPSRSEGALLALALLALGSHWAPRLALINETGSLPKGVYVRAFGADPVTGQVVAVTPSPLARTYLLGLGQPREMLLLKRVAATDGTVVCRSGEIVGTQDWSVRAQRRDRRGQALPMWRGCVPLTGQELFVLGDTPDSFDSRYFGPVQRHQVAGVYKELITW